MRFRETDSIKSNMRNSFTASFQRLLRNAISRLRLASGSFGCRRLPASGETCERKSARNPAPRKARGRCAEEARKVAVTRPLREEISTEPCTAEGAEEAQTADASHARGNWSKTLQARRRCAEEARRGAARQGNGLKTRTAEGTQKMHRRSAQGCNDACSAEIAPKIRCAEGTRKQRGGD